jgi:hypothetical protein
VLWKLKLTLPPYRRSLHMNYRRSARGSFLSCLALALVGFAFALLVGCSGTCDREGQINDQWRTLPSQVESVT